MPGTLQKPRLFVGSSSESRNLALAVHTNLTSAAETTVWNQNVFEPQGYTLDSLVRQLKSSEFAAFVFSADDVLLLREREHRAIRDNVLFEFGLAVGILGRERVFALVPEATPELRTPTDLSGITFSAYEVRRSDGNLEAATAPACRQIQQQMERLLARRACGYLKRYVEREEPSLLDGGGNTRVSYERFYQILLYMFENEVVDQFSAFDLAFDRWIGLLRPSEDPFNVPNEIFRALDCFFAHNPRCDFRRILVVTKEQLGNPEAAHVLTRFAERETHWRTSFPELFVETRVLVYPDQGQVTQRRIRQLQDFALFQGEDGCFALVEPTLTHPENRVATADCRVVTHQEEMGDRERGFAGFWKDSTPIPVLLTQMRDRGAPAAGSGPVPEALNYLLGKYRDMHTETALIIEAGYFDLRYPTDPDRFRHLDDAFTLLAAVQNTCRKLRGRVFLEAFLNDFSAPYCNIDACPPELVTDDAARRRVATQELLGMLKRRYAMHELEPDEFRSFSMRQTRTAAGDTLRRALREGHPFVREENADEDWIDIFSQQPSAARIHLARREGGSIIPRCSALLAQHYFDLYQFARERCPELRELWIFDFNRLTERDSVRLGADTAFHLFDWPPDFSLQIVNCVYSADGRGGSTHVSTLPRARARIAG
jgi:hypothetical protein